MTSPAAERYQVPRVQEQTIRDRISLALPRSASSDGSHFLSEQIPKTSIEGSKNPFLRCQLAILTIEEEGFLRKSRGDCSHDMGTAGFVIVSNIPSRHTRQSNFLTTSLEKSLILMATLCFVHPASTDGVATHSSHVINASALSCRTSVAAVTNVLDQIINLHQERPETLHIPVIDLIIAWHKYMYLTPALSFGTWDQRCHRLLLLFS